MTLAVAAGMAVTGAVGIVAETASATPAPQLVTKAQGSFSPSVNGLRIRSGPGTGYGIYGLLYRADRFAVTGSAARGHGTWYRVELTRRSASGLRSGHTGWVYAPYVRHV